MTTPKLTPALDGFIWCDTCRAPVPAAGHEHQKPPAIVLRDLRLRADRLRFALERVVANSSEATDAGAIARDALGEDSK